MPEPQPLAETPLTPATETAAETAALPDDHDHRRRPAGIWGILNDYITLTKPTIILMLLITAAGGMFLAQGQQGGGLPPLTLLALVWIGGAFASGGANALNHYLDRDIDRMMRRTSHRPVVRNRIRPQHALSFGIALNLVAAIVLTLWVNWLAAALTMAATLFYVLIYTLWLKRTTPQNIVIGGAAGAFPPMVGWAAITGAVDLPALYLFAIIFFWTPPHFWALALLIQRDYEQAGVPMLPVVSTRPFTVSSIFLYSIALVGLTLMFALTAIAGWLYAAAGIAIPRPLDAGLPVGWIYTAAALPLGAIFLGLAWRLKQASTAANARRLYLYSLLYLALLFLSLMLTGITGW